MSRHEALFVGAILVAIAGCGSSSSGDAAPAPSAPSNTVKVYGKMKNLLGGTPIAGAKLCIIEPAGVPCVTTAEDGTYTIPAVPKGDALTTVEKPPFLPALGTFRFTTDYEANANLTDGPLAVDLLSKVGVTYDTKLGGVVFAVTDGTKALANVVVTLSPMVGVGPVYSEGVGFLKDAKATGPGGAGGFANLPEGTYEITFSGAGTCDPAPWRPAATPNTYTLVVRNGYLTYIIPTCKP